MAQYDALGRALLEEAIQGLWWHRARVRVARAPRMPMSTIQSVLRRARDLGLPDMEQDQQAAEAFMDEQAARHREAQEKWLAERNRND